MIGQIGDDARCRAAGKAGEVERERIAMDDREPPFRPQVHFLVRPENLRTYHLAFPALDALPVPKVRQNLQPEDDVAAIVTGT